MKKKQDYGSLIIFMAIAVGLPRWAGAMMAADGIQIIGWLSDVFKMAYGISGLGMAVLEVISIGYIFESIRSTNAFNGKIPNLKFWGSVVFGLIILALIPLILTPYMSAQINQQALTVVLADMGLSLTWLVAVVIAPLVIIGGVSFARAGLMDIVDNESESKRERGLRLRRENAQRKRDTKKAEQEPKPTVITDWD